MEYYNKFNKFANDVNGVSYQTQMHDIFYPEHSSFTKTKLDVMLEKDDLKGIEFNMANQTQSPRANFVSNGNCNLYQRQSETMKKVTKRQPSEDKKNGKYLYRNSERAPMLKERERGDIDINSEEDTMKT